MSFLLHTPFAFLAPNAAAGGGGDPSGNQDDDEPTGGEPNPKDKTFTQEQVNKMVADARKQGRDSQLSQLLEKAKFQSADEMLTALDTFRQAEEEKLSKEEKAQKALADADTKNKALEDEIRTTRFERLFDKGIRGLGLEFQNEKAHDMAVGLLKKEMDGKDAKAMEDEMEEALKGLTTDYDYLFKAPDEDDVDIDATRKGKGNTKIRQKELVESKRRSGKYAGI